MCKKVCYYKKTTLMHGLECFFIYLRTYIIVSNKDLNMEENSDKLIIDWDGQDGNKSTSILISNGFTAQVLTTEKDGYKNHILFASSIGDKFMDAITGKFASKALELLIIAVNNRTKERDYFRLYCDMLDGSITEDEFDKEIEENSKEYVVDDFNITSKEIVELALRLSEHIKSVNSVDDLSSLFSFDVNKVNSLMLENKYD